MSPGDLGATSARVSAVREPAPGGRSLVAGAGSRRPGTLERWRLGLWMGRAGIGALVIVAWTVAVRARWVDKFFVSEPSDIFRFLVGHFVGEILPHGAVTVASTLIAFALAGTCGVLAALLLSEVPLLRELLDPFITALNALPRIALAPLFILWFGIGIASKVAVAFSLTFFIVLLNTMAGFKNVDPNLLRLSRSLGCSRWQQFTKITFPWAVPSIFAGFKLGIIYCFMGVILGEMLASKAGLGQLVVFYAGVFRTDGVLAILLVLAVAAILLSAVADWVESLLLGSWIEPFGKRT
ncbi:MAG TPA: ABC transporter permease [Methylomirabilota bacterium]|jgi:NitT/TauT family transport system permease protein|nr:ABC transporter permease [Methylomirabilota bacterium]